MITTSPSNTSQTDFHQSASDGMELITTGPTAAHAGFAGVPSEQYAQNTAAQHSGVSVSMSSGGQVQSTAGQTPNTAGHSPNTAGLPPYYSTGTNDSYSPQIMGIGAGIGPLHAARDRHWGEVLAGVGGAHGKAVMALAEWISRRTPNSELLASATLAVDLLTGWSTAELEQLTVLIGDGWEMSLGELLRCAQML